MADRKLNSIKFPDLADRYILDADNVNYSDSETYKSGSVGEALQKSARIDGTYDELTAGSAEQLLSSAFVEDTEPYKYRTTGGSADVGDREYVDAIVGGSVAWNQLVPQSGKSFTSTTTDTKALTLALVTPSYAIQFSSSVGVGKGNFGAVFSATEDGGLKLKHNGDNADITIWLKSSQTITAGHKFLFSIFIVNNDTTTVGGLVTNNLMLFDLTQMFGTTIADHIYSLEQSNAGAGVAFFKALFPNDYYAYDSGSIKSVEGVSEHVTVGFNQWDEDWELGAISATGTTFNSDTLIRTKNFNACLPSTQYYVKSPKYLRLCWYDENKTFVSVIEPKDSVHTSPSNAHFFKFCTLQTDYGTVYNHDICINLSWSGWRNGEYEPYQKHSYALDSSLTLRGIPKLANGKLYFDGDEYKYDGTVKRNIGSVDLGDMTYFVGGDAHTFYATIDGMAENTTSIFASGYSAVPTVSWAFYTAVGDKKMATSGSVLYVSNASCSTAEEIKSAMSGVTLLFKLATPTTETADPYQQIQICDDFGTEEYTSTSIVPIGHKTRYPSNLRDKLQHLPNLAENDGYYMINQTNKQMSLELFRIPKAPSANGTYVLKATVSGGTPTYTWVEEN